tara:strand:+ start:4957 stop:7236 length:2280 start_codon:yes stop_codon:yes gene_type:complete
MLGSWWFGGEEAFEIEKSCRFNDGDSPSLSRTYTQNAPWTLSVWIKRCELASENLILGSSGGEVHFNSDDTLEAEGTSTSTKYQDVSGWLHLHISNNGIFVNGSSVGSCTTTNLSNTSLFTNFDGYVAELHLQNGTNAVGNFGETSSTSGQWIAKKVTAGETYLKFDDSSNLGLNSGSGGNWTANNLVAGDQMNDTPSNNHTVWNSLDNPPSSGIALENGNLAVTISNANFDFIRSTIPFSSGKWYCEWTLAGTPGTSGGSVSTVWGIAETHTQNDNEGLGESSTDYGFIVDSTSATRKVNSDTPATLGSGASAGQTVQMAVDMDNLKIWWGINNTWLGSGNPSTGANPAYSISAGTYCFAIGRRGTNMTTANNFNFGQTSFTYTPPSDFLALNSENLGHTIDNAESHFQCVTWTGNGSSRNIDQTGSVSFQPDIVMIKNRSTTDEMKLVDAVHGATKKLSPNTSDDVATESDGVTSFDSDGFGLGTGANGYNDNTESFVGWMWKAGNSTSANTDGSTDYDSTVSANQTAGISVVTYTEPASLPTSKTVGHGLNLTAIPEMIIVKSTSTNSRDWAIYHSGTDNSNPENYVMNWNSNSNRTDVSGNGTWADTKPTGGSSGVFSMGNSDDDTADGGDKFMSYIFTPVAGFSAFGKFTGNGQSGLDGPYVTCGFKPALLVIKELGSDDWVIYDNARNPTNPAGKVLRFDSTAAEFDDVASRGVNLNASGFQIITSNATINSSGTDYIYYAFAEASIKHATAR